MSKSYVIEVKKTVQTFYAVLDVEDESEAEDKVKSYMESWFPGGRVQETRELNPQTTIVGTIEMEYGQALDYIREKQEEDDNREFNLRTSR